MSRIFKAPNVQLNQENFLVPNTPVITFNEELKEQGNLIRNEEFQEIDDDINFGSFDFEEAEINRLNENETEIGSETATPEEIQEAKDIVTQAKDEALEILEKAETEAKKLIEQAENEKEEIIDNSGKEGYARGFEQGLKSSKDELDRRVEKIKRQLEDDQKDVYKQFEIEAVDVIADVLENIIGNAFVIDNNLITQLVKIGLKQAAPISDVSLKVSETCYQTINDNIETIKTVIGRDVNIKVISDLGASDDECIIESEIGYIKCDTKSIIKSLRFNLETLLNSD